MRFYYASKISDNMSVTPEGFLLCQNVPIARTGEQIYLADELGLSADGANPRAQITVNRFEDDVFSPAAIASFEGKPVTDDHPSADWVTPETATRYVRGTAKDIRRGEGGDADKLIADLVIYDAALISEIQNGKREISCGYDCDNVRLDDGRVCQKNIMGNHVAVVSAGRAGSNIAIKDASPEIEGSTTGAEAPKKTGRSKRNMRRNKKPSETSMVPAIANLFHHFSKDADPAELSEVVEDLVDVIAEEVKGDAPSADETPAAPLPGPTPKADDTPEQEAAEMALLRQIMEKVTGLESEIAALKASAKADEDPLSNLENELQGEESVTVPVEEINEEETEPIADGDEGVISPPGERPKNPLNKDARAAALKAVRDAKPIIAKIKDPAERKRMSDSMAAMIRAAYGAPPKKVGGNTYAGIVETRERNVKDKLAKSDARVKDAAPLGADIGRKIRDSRNPHYAKKAQN